MASKHVKLAIAAVAAGGVVGVVVRSGHEPVAAPESPAGSQGAAMPPTAWPPAAVRWRATPHPGGDIIVARRPAAVPEPPRNTGPAPAEGADAGAVAAATPYPSPPEDIPSLGHMALTDANPVRRIEAIHLLSATEDPKAIPYLRQALSDPDGNVRLAILRAIAEVDFTTEESMELLSPVVTQDASPDIRRDALRVLSKIDAARVVAVAEQALNDPDEDVRALAEQIVGSDEVDASDDQD